MSPKEKNVNEPSQQYITDEVVNAFWSQYDSLISNAREFTLESERVWNKVTDEARRLQRDGRERAEEFVHQFTNKGFASPVQENTVVQRLAEQFQTITGTPICSAMDYLEKTESTFQERTSEIAKAQSEQRLKLWNMHDVFTQTVRNNQRTFFRFVEGTMRPIVHS